VNVALVGAGYWGQKLLPKFLAAPQALVRVVCDIHAENRAEIQRKFPEVATAESFAAVIADRQLDAVVIVTPAGDSFFTGEKDAGDGETCVGGKAFGATIGGRP
jgi:predicted dehydrogenase